MATLSQPQYNSADMPQTWRHWWITIVTGLGQLVGTAVATIAGVIIPMILITTNNNLSSAMQGLIGAADLIGIMVGSVVFGNLSDRYGYLSFFRLCPVLITGFALLAIFVPNVWVLVVSLFMIGFGIGGEYSLDSDYVSVLVPDHWKLVMLGMCKTGAAFGNIFGAALCFWMVLDLNKATAWPDLMWIVVGIGALMIITRIYFFESPKWLYDHGEKEKAVSVLHKFLGNNVSMSPEMMQEPQHANADQKLSFFQFAKKFKNRVMLTGVPWACEGLGVYGIGVFIPILVMALGIEKEVAGASAIAHVAQSVKTTLWISCLILPGFLIGIWLAQKKVREAHLQTISFWACCLSLLVLLFSYHFGWPKWISLVSFMTFELFLNIGPHLVTYLLPPKVYPVEVRGQGTGIAAAIGKAGAVAAVFIIPVLLNYGGGVLVLSVSAVVMAIGAVVTRYYGKKVGADA